MSKRGLVLSGARAVLMLEGVKMMYCTNVNYSEEIQHEPIEPLDQLEVAEFVPVGYRVTFSAQHVRVITNAIKLRDGIRVFPRLESILSTPEMTGTILDRVTGSVLANVERVRAQRYSSGTAARSITLVDVEFNAVRIRDESELSG